MTPELIGALVNSAIPLVGGVVAAWLGFRPAAPPAGAAQPMPARLRGALRVLGPLLVAWSVVSFALSVATAPRGPDRAAVVAGINARMPTMADEATRIDRVEDRGDKLVYHGTLVTLPSQPGLAAGALDAVAVGARAAICGQPEQRAFLEAMGPLRTELSYADGPLAGAYEINVSDCKDGGVAPR